MLVHRMTGFCGCFGVLPVFVHRMKVFCGQTVRVYISRRLTAIMAMPPTTPAMAM